MFQLPEGTPSRAETEWRALETCIQPRPVPDLRWLGRDYRGGTNLLAVELVAAGAAPGNGSTPDQAAGRPDATLTTGFSAATDPVMGSAASDYLGGNVPAEEPRRSVQMQTERVACNIGVNIGDLVEDMADAVAFDRFSQTAWRSRRRTDCWLFFRCLRPSAKTAGS